MFDFIVGHAHVRWQPGSDGVSSDLYFDDSDKDAEFFRRWCRNYHEEWVIPEGNLSFDDSDVRFFPRGDHKAPAQRYESMRALGVYVDFNYATDFARRALNTAQKDYDDVLAAEATHASRVQEEEEEDQEFMGHHH